MQNFACSFRPKVASAIAVIFIGSMLAAGVYLRGSLPAAWNMLHIPANTPLFSDTRGITHAIDCVLHGQDPYAVSTFDPWHRLYNYPPMWLLLRYLGVTSASSNLMGLLFALMAISAYLFLLNARTLLTAPIVFLAVTSRCVLLSIERGNTDQVVFFLLVSGFFLIYRRRPEIRSRLISALLILLTILKVYPIAAVTVFLERRRWRVATITVLAAAGALLATSGRRLAFVFANTPRELDVSFGAFPFFYALSRHTIHLLTPVFVDHRSAAPLAALLLGSACMLAGILVGSTASRILPPLDSSQTRGAIAIACLSIFCSAFVAGSSFDYRLIYLTGGLAWLVEDLDKRQGLRSLPLALLILLLLWKPFWLSFTGELIDGIVFMTSCLWLGNSLFSRRKDHQPLDTQRRRKSAAQRQSSMSPIP